MQPKIHKAVLGAFVTWLVPLFVSFFLFDPEAGRYFPNFIGFKIIMFLILAGMTFATYRWVFKGVRTVILVPVIYLAVNSTLDWGLLVGVFGMPIGEWALTILPIYITVFFGVFFAAGGTGARDGQIHG